MMPGELGSGLAKAASGWAARVSSPRVLILAAAALLLTNIPLARYRSGGQPDYFLSSLSVLLGVAALGSPAARMGRLDCGHGRRAGLLRTVGRKSDQYRPARMVDPHYQRSRHPDAGYLAQPAHPPLGRQTARPSALTRLPAGPGADDDTANAPVPAPCLAAVSHSGPGPIAIIHPRCHRSRRVLPERGSPLRTGLVTTPTTPCRFSTTTAHRTGTASRAARGRPTRPGPRPAPAGIPRRSGPWDGHGTPWRLPIRTPRRRPPALAASPGRRHGRPWPAARSAWLAVVRGQIVPGYRRTWTQVPGTARR